MKKLLTAILLGLTVTMSATSVSRAQQVEQADYGWCYYASYHCYDTACSKARYLRDRGYCTKIVYYSGCYAVYYTHH